MRSFPKVQQGREALFDCFSRRSLSRAKRGIPEGGKGEAELLSLLSNRHNSYSTDQNRSRQDRTDRVEQKMNTCSRPKGILFELWNGGSNV
jgi:hypothetical protein